MINIRIFQSDVCEYTVYSNDIILGNSVKPIFRLLLAGPKAQPTSVRQQIRILDIIATFDALFENDK